MNNGSHKKVKEQTMRKQALWVIIIILAKFWINFLFHKTVEPNFIEQFVMCGNFWIFNKFCIFTLLYLTILNPVLISSEEDEDENPNPDWQPPKEESTWSFSIYRSIYFFIERVLDCNDKDADCDEKILFCENVLLTFTKS